MPEHVLMSEIEIITDGGRRRRWSAAEKLRIVEETLDERASISVVARRNGVAPNLLYRWRRLMLEGGSVAVAEDDDVTSNRVVRQLEDRIRELERQLGRKTLEAEILREALDKARFKKTDLAGAVAAQGRFPVKVVADTLDVARSNLVDRLQGRTKPRRRYHKAQDAAVVPKITALVAARPTYGYRRITAILNRQLRSEGLAPANHKRIYRIMKAHKLLLARKYSERPEHVHDGKVIVMRSNLRWCSDGFEFTCWNGDILRGAFIIDAHDREVIAWRAVVNAGISGSDIRDIMLEAVERRFGTYRAPSVIEMLSDNGSPYIARDTQVFARQLGLKPCFTPIQSPQSNGISEAFVKTLKRDYVQVTPLPDAQTVLGLIGGWIEDYNNNHPHSGLKMRSPREFIAAQTATA
ncbi:IS3 family transposase [Paracoccus sp. MC1862]|uniref:IS3 family transposase n=1 Tax=Paracoccus sp. MC1862 TaxID=2760307 RepID=UPI0016007432|nr:IS3 family transposase [Paracoccus sp. MC1862]MBB1499797.1 IS3 family transposase [Paracoccus sp. MC1862]QQO46005.1 IS3 family transposase [Paracoccus sp. MC1862]QQO46545.1 IS3 family transposase [Paracoccus sp. MC1862]